MKTEEKIQELKDKIRIMYNLSYFGDDHIIEGINHHNDPSVIEQFNKYPEFIMELYLNNSNYFNKKSTQLKNELNELVFKLYIEKATGYML
jgi:hypothetical protein